MRLCSAGGWPKLHKRRRCPLVWIQLAHRNIFLEQGIIWLSSNWQEHLRLQPSGPNTSQNTSCIHIPQIPEGEPQCRCGTHARGAWLGYVVEKGSFVVIGRIQGLQVRCSQRVSLLVLETVSVRTIIVIWPLKYEFGIGSLEFLDVSWKRVASSFGSW